MVLGYCRVSTPKQNIERQIRNIREKYPDAVIVQETYTGTSLDRPKWSRLIGSIKRGKYEKVVFDSVSRMSRSAEEGSKLYEELFQKGIELEFIKEPQINTSTYREALKKKLDVIVRTGNDATDQLMSSIVSALNEYILMLAKQQVIFAFEASEREVTELRQRTKEGMITAKLNGKRIGRIPGKKYPSKKELKAKRIIKKYHGRMCNADIIRLCGVTKGTYYKYLNEILSASDVSTPLTPEK